jgi:hypothetical protein
MRRESMHALRAGLRRAVCPTRLLLAVTVLSSWALPSSCALAQTLHLQGARLDDVATTITLDLGVSRPLGGGGGEDEDRGLPAPGQVMVKHVSPWIGTARLGVGASLAGRRGDEDAVTVVGHLGVLARTDFFIDRVGLVVFGNLEPLAAGPAVRAQILAVGLQAGGLWHDDSLGFRWFASADLSLAFLGDIFGR